MSLSPPCPVLKEDAPLFETTLLPPPPRLRDRAPTFTSLPPRSLLLPSSLVATDYPFFHRYLTLEAASVLRTDLFSFLCGLFVFCSPFFCYRFCRCRRKPRMTAGFGHPLLSCQPRRYLGFSSRVRLETFFFPPRVWRCVVLFDIVEAL